MLNLKLSMSSTVNTSALIEAMEAWDMYFNGATNRSYRGAAVLLIIRNGVHPPLALKLEFPAMNNATEYEEALIFKIET